MTSRVAWQRLRYGGDYNPEQWPRSVWDEDIELMVDAGVNLVTVGVFSWAELEPSEGAFSFSWLVEVLDRLHAAGIGADLATPTAAPPAWLATRYPDSLPVDARGARYSHGSRQHFCVCSPDYRRLAQRIVTELVDAVGAHPAIELWHLHNEYACHVPYCYCGHHERAFRSWLKRRYSSIDELNAAWGTAFWSQRYGDFEEVVPPRMTPTFANPAQQLDYRRFSSDAFLEELREERAIVNRARPELPVTTNFMGWFKPVDYFGWARELDVVSTDNYPDPLDRDSPMLSAMHYDLVRSLDKGKPWLVMEQASSRVNWREHNGVKVPGAMRGLTYQAIARGAEGVLFFQWRASRAGAEKFHSAMVPHAGSSSRVFAEVAALGRELQRIGQFSTPVAAEVAIVTSWPNWWALEEPGKPANDLRLSDQLAWMYGPLFRGGVGVDFCHPGEPLEKYEAVLVPSLYLLSEAEGENLVAYVERGGTALISFWSGIVDECDRVYLGPYGGPIRSLFGGDVVDVAPLAQSEALALSWSDGSRSAGSFWADVITNPTGRVLASIAEGPYDGHPVVLESSRGKGRAYYLGTRLDRGGLERLYAQVPALGPVAALADCAGVVERVLRRGPHQSEEFFINHSDAVQHVALESAGVELLSGERVTGRLVLAPRAVAIVRRAGEA